MGAVEEIKAVLDSDLPHAAVRLWLWIRINHQGECSLTHVAKRWGDASSSISALTARDLLAIERGALVTLAGPPRTPASAPLATRPPEPPPPSPPPASPAPRARRGAPEAPPKGASGRDRAKWAFANPKRAGAAEAIREATEWAFRRYAAARKEQGLPFYGDRHLARNRKHFRELARYVVENDIDIDVFIAFAFKESRWQKTPFPSPSLMAGSWLQEKWEEKKETVARVGSAHAGSTYAEADADDIEIVRRVAKALDYDDLDDDMLDYLATNARTLCDRPHLYSPDPEYKDIEEAASRVMKG